MASARDRRKRRQTAKRRAAGAESIATPQGGATTRSGAVAATGNRAAGADERPPAPWGSLPLVEIAVLTGLVMLILGFVSGNPILVGMGLVLGSLAGLELSVREHFAGYRSHTTLLAATAFVVTVGAVFYLADVILLVALAAGAAVFAASAYLLRRAFRRASGGLSYKIGGLRP